MVKGKQSKGRVPRRQAQRYPRGVALPRPSGLRPGGHRGPCVEGGPEGGAGAAGPAAGPQRQGQALHELRGQTLGDAQQELLQVRRRRIGDDQHDQMMIV